MKTLLLLSIVLYFNNAKAQIIKFDDQNFKTALINKNNADSNGDNEISHEEALKLTSIYFWDSQVTSIVGIEYFNNLTHIDGNTNGIKDISKINSKNHPKLVFLNFEKNRINNLHLEDFINLKVLRIFSNQIENLTLINLPLLTVLNTKFSPIKKYTIERCNNLKYIDFYGSSFSTLHLENFDNLVSVSCYYCSKMKTIRLKNLENLSEGLFLYNFIDTVELANLPNLSNLSLYSDLGNLTALELKDLPNLSTLHLGNGKLNTLKLENLPKLKSLSCQYNSLTSMYIKSGSSSLKDFNISNNLNLKYICCDEINIQKVTSEVAKNGYTQCEVNSYCTLVPSSNYHYLLGNTTYDDSQIGCDNQSYVVPYAKFRLSQSGNIVGYYIGGLNGKYKLAIPSGTYTIQPIVDNEDFFDVKPSFFSFSLPSITDSIEQNFCINPKAVLHQILISIVPLKPTRPGEYASYKIIWENTGNQIESGILNFTYNEAKLDYLSASQNIDFKSDGIANWNFTNLKPFEKREIIVTLSVNKPTDTPAINPGDKLYFEASIHENSFTLENTVVGSYDPNDKTCLQGDRIHPDQIGKYVDFLIRFENTGNFAAENVVVKDIIDIKKFDVSSLLITDASHQMYTRIDSNKVEFIFEKIHLPFDDAYNDGHVAFKIKTLPTLIVGDSLKNLADIYFDYNFPIRTNESKSTISLISNTNEVQTALSIYPNPVKDFLFIDMNETWTKAEIYDLSGRIIKSALWNGSSIDVQTLTSGTYIIKTRSKTKTSLAKFTKI